MIKLLTANSREEHKRYTTKAMSILLKAQVENSIQLGWEVEDIYIISNFDFKFMGVKAIRAELNKHCWTGSKMFALHWLLENIEINNGIIWSADTDVWQNVAFDPPDFKDVGIITYSSPKYNGGSVFWKTSAKDIIDRIVEILKKGEEKEEPTINKILNKEFPERTTVFNTTYNVGCSGFFPRIYKAEKPVKVCHLNPQNRIAWETHRLDRNGLAEIFPECARSVSPRLEKLLHKYFNLAIKLSDEGRHRSIELREQHLKKVKKLEK